MRRKRCDHLTGIALVAMLTLVGTHPARALFGLFGESPPAPTATTLPYQLRIEGTDRALRQKLEDASLLHRLRQDAPQDVETLLSRASRDIGQITDALWAEGYYNAKVAMTVAGQPLTPYTGDAPASARRAAEAQRGRAVVPVAIRIEPGRQFVLNSVRVLGPQGQVLGDVPQRRLRLKPGDPASAPELREAQARIVDHYRGQSRPLTAPGEIDATVNHVAGTMDAIIHIRPGVVAPIGPVAVTGNTGVPEHVIRSFIYAQPGDAYSPEAVAGIRKSVLKIPAIGSARVREAEVLNNAGQLPLDVAVTERPLRLIGASARFSSTDGPALRAYWEHRNLFGGAEHLRLEGETFALPEADRAIRNIDRTFLSRVGGRLKLSFMKPALYGTRNDLVIGVLAERDRSGGDRYGGYGIELFDTMVGVRHRFTDNFFVQGGLRYEAGRTTDALGTVRYNAIGLPLSANYDSTDSLLDPTRGMRFIAQTTPYFSLGSAPSFYENRAQLSAYYAFDQDARYILAGRIALGSVIGGKIGETPANHRFYAGGAGSVRGYRSRSLGPLAPNGKLIGGRSLVEMSAEMRIRVTETFGIVPFIDAGGAFESSYPDFKEKVRAAAGIGLRYYTAIGPIRLDIATPLNRRKGDKPIALYVSIGQAF